MGTMLEFAHGDDAVSLRLYISGDTLLIEELEQIPRRYPSVDAAVLHLGGTRLPGGLMVTMNAVQGADLMQLVDPGMTVPVHFDDYRVFKSPLSDFRAEVSRRGISERVRFVDRGDSLDLRARSHENGSASTFAPPARADGEQRNTGSEGG
jgi:L-ascorbate metabolism protein UlaG (beta-lactamase superfamily)